MGNVWTGVPERLVEALQQSSGIRSFVETGTFEGGTTKWAAQRFDKVATIEASRALYDRARETLRSLPNVEAILGDTRTELERIVQRLTAPAIFWLDAHWSGGDTHGEGEECPIQHELDVVLGATPEHLVLIDDARLFLSPPPRPHRPEQWPGIRAIVAAVERRRPDAYVAIVEDVIVIVPPSARAVVVEHCQDVADALEREFARSRTERRLRRCTRLLAEALRTLTARRGRR